MAYAFGAPSIVQDGLVFYVDAANKDSYVNGSSDTFSLINPSLTGSLKNNTSFKSNNAGVWDFDGTDDYIDCGSNLGINNASTLTFNFWWKSDNLDRCGFLGDDTSDSSTNVFHFYTWANGTELYVFFKSGGTGGTNYVASFNNLVTTNQWYMLTLVFDGTQGSNNDRLKIYLNGGPNNILTNYDTIPTTFTNASDNFFIGEGVSADMAGEISNAQIYNRALSSIEILQNYNALKGRFI